jgi:hypothetical protein
MKWEIGWVEVEEGFCLYKFEHDLMRFKTEGWFTEFGLINWGRRYYDFTRLKRVDGYSGRTKVGWELVYKYFLLNLNDWLFYNCVPLYLTVDGGGER